MKSRSCSKDFDDLGFPSLILVVSILFIAALVRSAFGFGDALIAVPLLALVVGIKTATPLSVLASTSIAAMILMGNWRKVDLSSTWRLIIATFLGIPFGLYLLTKAPVNIVMSLLGILLIFFGGYSLRRPRLVRLESKNYAYLFGFMAGVLGGAYNTSGPPIVIYGTLREWSAERFRATLQGYFFPTELIILAVNAISGLWTTEVLRYYLISLPFIIVATFLGGIFNRRLSGKGYNPLIYSLLIALGLLLVIRS